MSLPRIKREFKLRQDGINVSRKTSITYSCNSPMGKDYDHTTYECTPTEFQSETTIRCINVDHLCNGIKECPNGDDEIDCEFALPSPNGFLTNDSELQGAVTYYALMATLCTVMVILILIAFFVHRFRKVRCESAFTGVSFAPLIYRPVGASLTFNHANCPNPSAVAGQNCGSVASLNGASTSANRAHPQCCSSSINNSLAFDRVFHPMSLSSSRFLVNYNVHNNCMRIVQSSRVPQTTPSTALSPPSYLETVLDPTYNRRSQRLPSVPDEPESHDAPPYESETDPVNQRGATITEAVADSSGQHSPPPPYSET